MSTVEARDKQNMSMLKEITFLLTNIPVANVIDGHPASIGIPPPYQSILTQNGNSLNN
jgi:hypothetical protein